MVSAARYNGRGYDCRLEVHGFHGTVVAGWDQGAPVRNVDPSNDFPEGPAHHFFMDRFTDAFRAELSAFVDVVNGTAAPACTGQITDYPGTDRTTGPGSRRPEPSPGTGH